MKPSLWLCSAVVFFCSFGSLRADVFRWDNGQLIPGTEGITPGPGVQLEHFELLYADLQDLDLTDSRFEFANLSRARVFVSNLSNANLTGANLVRTDLYLSTLTDANLSGADLTDADLHSSNLTNTNLSGAVVTGADFKSTTSRGFTKEQLYLTASYQAKDLSRIGLADNDLSGWNLSGQKLNDAWLNFTILSDADLSGASLTNSYLSSSTLTDARFTNADLTNAHLSSSTLTNVDLSGAVVTGASFSHTTSRG